MYNIKSRQAEEFINHQEILDTLEYAQANRNNRPLIESLIDKAALCQGLSHREAALLLECDEPELVQRIRAEGHQIGNHTYDHAPLDRLSCGEAMADLSRCDGVLQELAGEGTYWVRPPYGFITEEELAAWSTPMLYWSVDTCDWECRDVQKVFAAICQARDGDVILLHDCYGTSVEAALQAIDCLSEQGGEFVTVEELFALRGQTAEAGHLYRRPE